MEQLPTILIIDDTPSVCMAISFLLRNEGFQVLTSSNGPEGRKLAEQAIPDLILLDIEMPEESGLDSAKLLKKNSATAEIPIIFLTASESIESKIAGFEAGAVDYIVKPYHRLEVLARVRTHLRLRKAIQSLMKLQTEHIANLVHAQQALLPDPALLPDAKYAAHFHPLSAVGGDIYDVFQLSEETFDYFVADVSGHDQGTAIPTAALQALFRQNCDLISTPEQILQRVNQVMCTLFPAGQYATAVLLRLNRRSKHATIVNAGHLPVIVCNASGANEILLESGDVIGAFQHAIFPSMTIDLHTNDRIILYTDGLIEVDYSKDDLRHSGTASLLSKTFETYQTPRNDAVEEIPLRVFGQQKPTDDVLLLAIDV